MTDTLHLDWETAADADLTKVGLDVYTSPRSKPRVLMGGYRINSSPLQHWEAHKRKIPAELKEALEDPEVEKWAFHAQFERVVTRRVLGINTPRRGWRCSQALAYCLCFMGGLEDVGEQIGLPLEKQKFKDGKRLIRKFSIPQKITANQPYEWRNWLTDPDDWELFCEYNQQDVITEEAVKHRLIRFPIPPIEWEYYELDQRINDRGIPVDLDFIENVIWMAAKRKAELLKEMQEITGVDNPNSTAQLLPWLQDNGYPYTDLRKETVQKTLKHCERFFGCPRDVEDEDAPDAVRALRRRQWAARTSVNKADKAKIVVGDDGRARFLFQFGGASRTLRFAGREIQSQNMMRTPKILDAEESDAKLSYVTDLIRRGDYPGFDLMFKEPMLAFTGCMRSMFRAPEGYDFQTFDFKSVESAGLAWVTRCERLLKVFADKRDPYRDFGQNFYQKPYDAIDSAERQICKPPALGCGYRLGPGGLIIYAENMGVDMTPEEAERAVKIFRSIYPEVPDFWYDCERAIRAVLKTHRPAKVGPITFEWIKPFLAVRLPSGRHIFYYKPRLEKRVVVTDEIIEKRVRSRGFFEDGAPKGVWITVEENKTYVKQIFTYMGKSQKTGQWTRLEGHGGVVTENIVQALTRDILLVGLMRLHKAGFHLIGHAHDEGMALIRRGDNRHTLELMREEMTAPIEWAPGFPLDGAGWRAQFYRK